MLKRRRETCLTIFTIKYYKLDRVLGVCCECRSSDCSYVSPRVWEIFSRIVRHFSFSCDMFSNFPSMLLMFECILSKILSKYLEGRLIFNVIVTISACTFFFLRCARQPDTVMLDWLQMVFFFKKRTNLSDRNFKK